MATLEEIVVQLTAETSSLRAELKGAATTLENSTEKMDKALAEFSKNSGKNLSFTQQALATLTGFIGSQAVLKGFSLLQDAASMAWTELAKGIETAAAEEAALTKLANSLQLTGKYTEETMRSLQAFTGEMESLTGVSDDVVASNLALLSTMTKLSGEGLMQAQKAALDLSSAMGMDLESATRLIGKGIEGNVGAFKKFGIEVQDSADKGQRFTNIMAALSTVSGASEANMKTFAGSVLGLKNSWGNLVEEFGRALTSNQAVMFAFSEVKNILDGLTSAAASNGDALRKGIAQGFIFVLESIEAVISGLNTFYKVAMAAISAVSTGVSTLYNGFMALGHVLKGDIAKAGKSLDNIADSANSTADAFDAVFSDNLIDQGIQKLRQVTTAAQAGFASMGEGAQAVRPKIQGAVEAIDEFTEAQKRHQEMIKAFAVGLADQDAALNSSIEFQRQLLDAQASDDLSRQVEIANMKMELLHQQFDAENKALADARAQGLITETQYQSAINALTQKHILDSQKALNDQKKAEDAFNKARVADMQSTLGTIATLQSSSSRELFTIGKAAAIAQATIDGYGAVQKALNAAPPPFNFGLAALVGAATAANVAKIAGVGLARGIDSVPGVGNRDNFPAVLAPGERVVPAETNKDLTSFLANERGQGSMTVNLNVNISPGTGISREQAGELVDALNDYFANGGLKLMGAT